MNPTLIKRLIDDSFGPTFVWPQHDQTIARIWTEPGNAARLEGIIDDRTAPIKARLIAAETLFKYDFSFLDRHDDKDVARIYADALASHTPLIANVWGLLWINERAGELGGRFIMLGDSAVPALKSLLDNSTVVDWYAGSEDATVGNGAKYRIKDFAAWYLARITNHPIEFHSDAASRDMEIVKLIASIGH
jgi:hypothetical protein